MKASHALDRIDRRILTNLQKEGRLTNQALAARVGLSPSACLARVRSLEENGIIQGYHARIDPFRLDIGLILFVEVALEGHRADERERFELAVISIPQVVEVSHVSGDVDYLLRVVVADMAEWTRVREELVGSSLGVGRVITHALMRKPKIFTGYPVADELSSHGQ